MTRTRDLEARNELAWARRVAHKLGLMDLAGHMSSRLPDGRGILVTPGPELTRVATIASDDILRLDLDGELLEGNYAVPAELAIDLAIYRHRPNVNAVMYASPQNLTAFGIAHRDVLAVTHTNAELAHQGASWCRTEGMVLTAELAEEVAASLGDRRFCHLPGMGIVVAAPTPFEAVRSCDTFEQLAQMSTVVAELSADPRVVTPQESTELVAQRPVEAVPSRDPRRYYAGVDRFVVASNDRLVASDMSVRFGISRAQIATACRTLYAQHTLVSFFEHISHRAPEGDDVFLMSPAKHFGLMEAADVGIVSTIGQCDNMDGPYPPAPFRWLHRDILAARPDINAIVHTHELYGRAFHLAGLNPQGAFRNGAPNAGEPVPRLETPSLVFSEEHRRAVVKMAKHRDTVHVIAHGTDFLAATLQEATVRAIHREQLCKAELEASRLGPVKGLNPRTVADLTSHGPTWDQWWDFYINA
jgi:ribulose-5-phosphate 4-epimerase/fuculose-1-phosphate aldolase